MSLRAEAVVVTLGGRRLLDAVSLDLRPGSLHALLGANGAGKSTLLRVLAGDIPPQSGRALLDDRALADWPLRNRALRRAVLPQSDTLTADFTVEEVVALGRSVSRRQGAVTEREWIEMAMRRCDVEHLRRRHYPQLSGGERTRVQLARVLAQASGPLPATPADRPRYLLLDEPTANLDLAHRDWCLGLLRQLAAEGYGVLVTLHEPDLALRHADQSTLLREGRVLASGASRDVLQPAVLRDAYDLEFLRFDEPQASPPRPRLLARS